MSEQATSPEQANVRGPSDVSGHDLDRGGPTPDSETTARSDAAAYKLRGSFLPALYEAIRTVKLHPVETAEVRQNLEDLAEAASVIFSLDAAFEMRIRGRLLYLNASRLYLDLENFASFSLVVAALTDAGVAWLRLGKPAGGGEWKAFISEVLRFGAPEYEPEGPEGVEGLRRALVECGVVNIKIGSPEDGETPFANEVERRRVAKQTYESSVAVTTDLLDGSRMGRSAHLKEMKQAVRSIVDQVLNNEVASVSLATLNDFDQFSFAHTVNVCIFSIAIGRRLGLTKNRLFDLGMAALLHDVGKSRIPLELIMKEGELEEEEQEILRSHTWLGALSAYRFRDYGEIQYRGMITAYEHHMKMDFSGYPKVLRPRKLSVFSKIVGLAAAFDAATSTRSYAARKSPDIVLRELREDPDGGHDPVLVKALINLLGIYPVGTCVILDTHELGIVHAANSDAAFIHRPIIRLICDSDGVWLDQPPLVNLADAAPDGSFVRSVIKVTEPEKYMINVADYFI
jgi:HD-GYP domain-containing protein (c-di-GMP phosphodiesterase class II)